MKNVDFLSISSLAVDAFIRLKDAHIHSELNKDKSQLCLSFGAKIPYEFVEVVNGEGNGANAAVCASRLGLSSALISTAGDDAGGENCLRALKGEKVDVSGIKIIKGGKTNYHYVLWYGDERTILINHNKTACELPSDIGTPKWIYMSSLGEDSLAVGAKLEKYLQNNYATKLAFQPGTFQLKLGAEKLSYFYKKADAFCVNVGEAQAIVGKNLEIKELLRAVKNLGPKMVLITDGVKGAYYFDGKNFLFMPPFPDEIPAYERTGAGDAFFSTFISMLALNKKPEEALRLAPINSMSVVKYVGAQKGLLRRHELENLLASARADYKPRIF